MVIAWSRRDDEDEFAELGAWQRVEKTQTQVHVPCLLVPQPAHAVLAGELAEALLPEIFGELPPEIRQAIMLHDTGWAMIDAAQIQRLRSDSPQPNRSAPVAFVCNSPQETVEAWAASINSVERLSTPGALIVSRHFMFLAKAELREHQRFIDAERTRQRTLAAKSLAAESDLARWTAALGFCDLVSLYLLTGLRSRIAFPLAHPAASQAEMASCVTLTFDTHRIRFNPPVFQTDSGLEIEGLKHPVSAGGRRAEKLAWEIV